MKILLTNDDGWDAPGLAALINVAKNFGEVIVVAPLGHLSGISHQMTFEVEMSFEEKHPGHFALNGTPADCVRVGLTQLGIEFDVVLSGINNGANLGTDVFVSGTVAGAREAAIFKVPSIAISQHRRNYPAKFDWNVAEKLANRYLKTVFEDQINADNIRNVNLPDVPLARVPEVEIVECEIDPGPLPYDYQKTESGFLYCGRYNERKIKPGCDVDTCFGGKISVTRYCHL